MGTERHARLQRRSDKRVIEDFGIAQMQKDMGDMAGTIGSCANALTNLSKKHDGIVKLTRHEYDCTDGRLRAHQANLGDLNELRNRGFMGRVKWLLSGR